MPKHIEQRSDGFSEIMRLCAVKVRNKCMCFGKENLRAVKTRQKWILRWQNATHHNRYESV